MRVNYDSLYLLHDDQTNPCYVPTAGKVSTNGFVMNWMRYGMVEMVEKVQRVAYCRTEDYVRNSRSRYSAGGILSPISVVQRAQSRSHFAVTSGPTPLVLRLGRIVTNVCFYGGP